nr:hypothetical protein [Tanacetum cinerariifolium]
ILVLILDVLALVLRTLTLALYNPQDCIVSFDIAFEVKLRHSLCLRNRGLENRGLISRRLVYLRSMKLALIERITQLDSTALTRAGVVDGVGVGDWFFLSKSNAVTMSLSSATSDEMDGVDELVPTLETTALARD